VPKFYSTPTKLRTIDAALRLMTMVGLQVTEIRDGDRLTIDVVIPPESTDPCGDNYLEVLESLQEETG